MNQRPGLEAVLCDAGGTLLRLDFEWMCADLEAQGVPVEAAALRRAEVEGRRAYDASIRPADPAGPAPRGDVRAYFAGMLAAAGVPQGALAGAIDRFLAREKTSGLWRRPMEGAREALDALRAMGLRIGVVSNSDGRAEMWLRTVGLLPGVEFVVDSHLVGIEKPDPAIFRIALGRLGTPPALTLFVGDIRSVDEAGAEAAGMRFVLVDPHGDYGGPETPRIAGMQELAAYVERGFTVARPPSAAPARASGGGPGGGRR